MVMKGYSAFIKVPRLAISWFNVISGHLLQRCSRCILQPQPAGYFYEIEYLLFYRCEQIIYINLIEAIINCYGLLVT